MALREDLVVGAVSFLQDPSVAGSTLDSKIKFLQSKNLTQEEIDTALARVGGAEPPTNYTNYAPPQQQISRPPQQAYGGYQQYPWQQPPPEPPKRDWRDWFIMATVMGGVGYGLYFVAKRYVYPVIAPPTAPQLEQDKAAIDESFEKAFALLEQLSKDTDALKASEEARTERLDTALTEVERVIAELKTSSRQREDESRRIGSEVSGLKDLIPKAMEAQKENADLRLKELNNELKSLKILMGQRMNPAASSSTNSYSRTAETGVSNASSSVPQTSNNTTGAHSADAATPKPATLSSGGNTEAVASLQNRSASPFHTGAPSGRAAIPSWQMASSKSSAPATPSGSGSQEQKTDGA